MAVEDGNLPWLEEDLPEQSLLEPYTRPLGRKRRLPEGGVVEEVGSLCTSGVLELVQELEGLTVLLEQEEQEELLQAKLSDWSVEVAKLCGLEEEEVREVWSEEQEVPQKTACPFPWQLVSSKWQEEEAVRKEKEETARKEAKERETAELWRRQALLLDNKKTINQEVDLNSSKAREVSLNKFAYFNTSAVEVGGRKSWENLEHGYKLFNTLTNLVFQGGFWRRLG